MQATEVCVHGDGNIELINRFGSTTWIEDHTFAIEYKGGRVIHITPVGLTEYLDVCRVHILLMTQDKFMDGTGDDMIRQLAAAKTLIVCIYVNDRELVSHKLNAIHESDAKRFSDNGLGVWSHVAEIVLLDDDLSDESFRIFLDRVIFRVTLDTYQKPEKIPIRVWMCSKCCGCNK